MPGRFTPVMQKALRSKAYTFQCNALSSDATTIQQTFAVQSGVLRGVRLNGITYPHDAAAIRLNDQNSVSFTEGGGTVPYTAAHSMVGKTFSVTAWIKTPSLCTSEFPIFQVAGQYYLSLTATQELQFKVGTDRLYWSYLGGCCRKRDLDSGVRHLGRFSGKTLPWRRKRRGHVL